MGSRLGRLERGSRDGAVSLLGRALGCVGLIWWGLCAGIIILLW